MAGLAQSAFRPDHLSLGHQVKFLLITFYYTPDLSTGSFRAGALVNALLERIGPDARIDIVTTTPHRYGNAPSA